RVRAFYICLYIVSHICFQRYSSLFFHDTATPEIYTLSLHDALPILRRCTSCTSAGSCRRGLRISRRRCLTGRPFTQVEAPPRWRSEEHTSELQSRENLVCRLLLEKKNK